MDSFYPLLEALRNRRSRRFGKGMALGSGPLAYHSRAAPQPLTVEEEAALTFAACGITGHALADLPFDNNDPDGGAGGAILHLVGRTVPTGEASHSVALFVLNDSGTWYIRRPQDYPRARITELVTLARDGDLVPLYEESRVQIAAERRAVSRELPMTLTFNRWSTNIAGTTTFLPVAELSALALNILLVAFDEPFCYFLLDDGRNYQPAGVAKFARSKGGHLYDNPADDRVATVSIAKEWLYEFVAVEQGAMLQNLGLMAAALDLGGFAYFAAHPYAWPEALGFRMQELPFTRAMGIAPPLKWLVKLLGRDVPVKTAVGLETPAGVLLRPYCPPYYRNMEEAVLAFVDYKWGTPHGTLRDATASAWLDASAVQAQLTPPSDKAVATTIAYCEYIHQRYGRFPAGSGPFRTVLAYQAHHLDRRFYNHFYQPDIAPAEER